MNHLLGREDEKYLQNSSLPANTVGGIFFPFPLKQKKTDKEKQKKGEKHTPGPTERQTDPTVYVQDGQANLLHC